MAFTTSKRRLSKVVKKRSPRNQTITLTDAERQQYQRQCLTLGHPAKLADIRNRVIHQNMQAVLGYLPYKSVDLLILDPPYNLTKQFNTGAFQRLSDTDYQAWFAGWFVDLLPLLKPDASVYVCADWRSSPMVYSVLQEHLIVRNRITWEREKGRGAKHNWKNASEDIWFATATQDYKFFVERVMHRRRVLAPYREDGQPKDWQNTDKGRFRLTYPSNLWTDISVPFWSMSENTDHPTQKPEKLLAKLILASSEPGDVVLDPFLGSGTTAVVAYKLKRDFIGIEHDQEYCCLAQKRLAQAVTNRRVQGYWDGVFWERNTGR